MGEKKIETQSQISDLFDEIVREHTAGSPMDADIVWTDITPSSLVKYYVEKEDPKKMKYLRDTTIL